MMNASVCGCARLGWADAARRGGPMSFFKKRKEVENCVKPKIKSA